MTSAGSVTAEAWLDGVLAQCGFRTTQRGWWREANGLYAVVSLQRSSWGSGRYLNCGFALSAEKPRGWLAESRCGVRFRPGALRALTGDDHAAVERDLDTRSPGLVPSAGDQGVRKLARILDDFLRAADTPSALVTAIDERLDGNLFVARGFLDRARAVGATSG